MLNTLSYAQFSANAYAESREVVSLKNEIPIAAGWEILDGKNNSSSGFLARAYTNTKGSGEIVIAYAGTTSEEGMKSTDWWKGNIPGATGAALPAQVLDAAKFYLDIRKANPNATITFTGHSLGGGLASLMAVLFNRPAYTFDEAPFERSADSSYVVDRLRSELKAVGYTLPQELVAYQTVDVTGTLPSPTRQERESLVSHTYVKGEILSLGQTVTGRATLAALGYFLFGPLGGVLGGTVTEIAGATQVIDPNAAGRVSPVDLHSMVLLTAFLQSQKFLQLSQANPELLPQVFGSLLNVDQKTDKHNFLNLMVQHEAASNQALSVFSDDLAKFKGVLGDGDIKSALYDLAIALHYGQGEIKAGAINSPFESLVMSISGGVQIAPDPTTVGTYAESLHALRKALEREFAYVAGFLDRDVDRSLCRPRGPCRRRQRATRRAISCLEVHRGMN